MKLVLLLLFISQVQLEKSFVNIVKRDVYTSSIQNLNRYTKTYEIDQNIILNTPNFTLIDSLLSIVSINQLKSSSREYTTWLIHPISSNQYKEIGRYDSTKQQFILNHNENFFYTINSNTGQLTLINTNNTNLLYTEIIMHSESGLSKGDHILHDIYRFIRLLTTSINCTRNVIVNIDESIEIECTIEYEFLKYDDLDNYFPKINLTFYIKENNSINQIYLNEIKDLQIDNNKILNWKRSIIYRIKSINKKENNREYICILISDNLQNKDLFQDNNRICRTRINIKNNHSSTVIFSRLNNDLIDILIIILIIFSIILFITSFILCIIAQQYHKKRTIQIKPELNLDKTITFPFNTNNNEIKSSEQFSSEHKPGCPKYRPLSEYNLLSSDLFTHTTIDNIKKIILPDIPENNDLFNDQTYIHFYIPSKTENI